MIIKGIDVNMHDINEYVKLQIYLFDKNNIIKIEKKIISSMILLLNYLLTLIL